ncbi:hypothetical protein [Paenibacillus tyrfis]|uniref:Uncharacterized protein n=1 Tax=Paenibacillus tyrfis TaxID=1501230 RepID=A0A081P7L4_9BACL|nr:hypothetical protein [Paenibacillus tyrfis]KEQ26687.1 hypothetical protein ET33_33155 [Paenibacillus tyrfis]
MVFNVKKSVVALGVAASLLATSFLPTEAAFAANTETAISSQRFQQLSASQSMLLNQTLSAGEIINPYIKVEDNLYKLDPAAADLVSKEVLKHIQEGLTLSMKLSRRS